MSDAQINTLRLYTNISNAAVGMDAYQTARRLGILEVLKTGQLTAEQIASQCNLNPKRVALLLEILCGLLILEKYGDDYALSQMLQLLTSHDHDLGQSRRAALDTFIQSQSPCEHDPTNYRNRITSMQWQATPTAMEVVKYLNLSQQTEPLRIIDVGCGTGVWSLTIARQDPQSAITFLDEADPVDSACRTAESIGMQDRFDSIVGDPFTAELPAGQFNLAIVANLLNLIPPEQWTTLIKRVVDSLSPRGRLAIIDVFPGQDSGDVTRATLELDLAMHVQHSGLCDPLALQQCIVDLGLEKPRYAHIDAVPYIYGLMLAARPS